MVIFQHLVPRSPWCRGLCLLLHTKTIRNSAFLIGNILLKTGPDFEKIGEKWAKKVTCQGFEKYSFPDCRIVTIQKKEKKKYSA